MNFLFAKLTNDCNLSCPHCNVLNDKTFNNEKFFHAIENFHGDIMAFGGEPSLYKERLLKLLSYDNVKYITTNLMILHDEYLEYYKRLKVATSWNLNRFNKSQYSKWLKNLNTLQKHDISCLVLITMTRDLIDYDIHEFMKIIQSWNIYRSINAIEFEYVIDDSMNKDFFNQCDEWLVNVHLLWEKYNIRIWNKISDDIFYWNKDCSNVYTLEPNGELLKRCPHNSHLIIREECLTCKYAEICRPCILQQHCTFPKKLYEYIRGTSI